MKRLGFIFGLLLLFVSSVSAKITVSDAQKIVKDYVEKKAGWKYDEVKVYQAPDQIKTVNIAFGKPISTQVNSSVSSIAFHKKEYSISRLPSSSAST